MDSETSAYACASQRHHRYMIYGKKQRYIEVFQCSGDDMNLVLTGAVTPPSTKALLSPGTLTTQTPATLTHPSAPTPVPVPVPVPTAQPPPPPPPLWDIHALVQAQAQAAQAVQAQAQVVQAQAVQAQAIRNQDFWLTMALASNPPPTSTPASPVPTTAAAVAAAATSKSLALPGPNSAIQAQIPAAAYAVASPAAAAATVALHAPPATAPGAGTSFLLFNVPPHHPHRIPILRTPTPHGLLAPIVHTAPALNPAAIMGLKRTWDNAFPSEATAGSVVAKRSWHAPAAAFHAPAPTATPSLPYPAQFYPQI